MKNQYFGDVNDYVKYGLLRCFQGAGLSLGVCWMLTPDDGRSDGAKVRYLSSPRRWRARDPGLFDALVRAVREPGGRRVDRAEQEILAGARFFGELVPDSAHARADWIRTALESLGEADLIFFDPDNGLQIPSKPRGRRNSSKYLYWGEVADGWAKGASLLIFQHFTREPRERYARRLARQLSGHTSGASIRALSSPNALFLLASQPGHLPRVEAAIRNLHERGWQLETIKESY